MVGNREQVSVRLANRVISNCVLRLIKMLVSGKLISWF